MERSTTEKQSLPHGISLQDRKKLSVSGVSDVANFDENQIIIVTQQGTLFVRGGDLHVDQLNLDAREPADFCAGCFNERCRGECGVRTAEWNFRRLCVRSGARRAVRCVLATSSAPARRRTDVSFGCIVFHGMLRGAVCAVCRHFSAAHARIFADCHGNRRRFLGIDRRARRAAVL